MEGFSNVSEGTFRPNQTIVPGNGTISKTYNVSPLPLTIQMSLTIVMALVGSVGMVANSLLLYIVRKQEKIRRRGKTTKSFARILTPYFIQSLALSDFFCSLVNLPVFISQLYSDVVQNLWGCRCVRYMNLFFAVVTLNNLLVIGIERYMALFHPFLLPSPKFCKILVVLAWIFAALLVLVPVATFKTYSVDLGPHEYTIICVYEKTVAVYRAMFIGFTAVGYIIPSIVLTVINIRILNFLRQGAVGNAAATSNTKMFVSLIFVFIIPYCLYVTYSGLNIALKIKFSFTTDYIVRRVSGIIAYSNAVVSPTIIFSSMPSLSNELRDLLRRFFGLQPNVTHPALSVPSMEEGSFRRAGPLQNIKEEIHQTGPQINMGAVCDGQNGPQERETVCGQNGPQERETVCDGQNGPQINMGAVYDVQNGPQERETVCDGQNGRQELEREGSKLD